MQASATFIFVENSCIGIASCIILLDFLFFFFFYLSYILHDYVIFYYHSLMKCGGYLTCGFISQKNTYILQKVVDIQIWSEPNHSFLLIYRWVESVYNWKDQSIGFKSSNLVGFRKLSKRPGGIEVWKSSWGAVQSNSSMDQGQLLRVQAKSNTCRAQLHALAIWPNPPLEPKSQHLHLDTMHVYTHSQPTCWSLYLLLQCWSVMIRVYP